MSQGSAFLLDADNTASFDFPAKYVVLNFDTPPPLARSAALFRTVGHIDRELFATETSGDTQYGRAYLSLQSDVPDLRFIDGYASAAAVFGVEYTPIVNGVASLFQGDSNFFSSVLTRANELRGGGHGEERVATARGRAGTRLTWETARCRYLTTGN